MNLESTIKKASQKLKNNNITSHALDAQIILADIIGVKRESLITNNQINISEIIIKKYDKAIKRRINHEPIAYITEKKEFWSENFVVNNSTLVPRPETELLIYKIIDIFKNKRINILDIGTGSGCILLSLLKELYNSRGMGIDISSRAIQTARINSKNLNLVNRAKFKNLDLDRYNLGRYDLIVSNPNQDF
jgi:release factor glutamine methyltransferase